MHLTHPKYRGDIDGLRAVAVLSVVGFHAFPNFVKGGFIGVDIFFVISGFLISTIIFGSLEQSRFSFVEFYSRRIKRIFPALMLVLISCYVFGWFALFADEYKQLGKHIVGGAGFASNFLLWNESGYFDKSADDKPLLHLWSLGIEEQFYIIWPLLLWLAWRLRLNLLTITMVVGVISFALNIGKVSSDAVAAFYSPQTRFWELLTGSVLAYIRLHKQNIFPKFKQKLEVWFSPIDYVQAPEANGNKLRNLQSVLGAALITIGIMVINKGKYFPGWWAALPITGTALIISAGPQAWFNRVVLSNRVLVWFGLVSFPLYLWHWPLLTFARIVEDETPSLEIRITAVLISIVLAWLTYRLIEKPMRSGRHSKAKTITLLVLMAATGFVGYNCYYRDGLSFRGSISQSRVSLDWPSENKSTKMCLEKYPELEKHLESIYCMISNKNDPTIALIGDSHANHFFYGLSAEYSKINENLVQLGENACPPLIDISSRYAGKDDWCKSIGADILKKVAQQSNIHTVILAANWNLYLAGTRFVQDGPPWEIRSLSNSLIDNNFDVFGMQMKETITLLRNAGKKIIIVKQIPELDFSPSGCIAPRPFKSERKQRECKIAKDKVQKYLSEYESYFDNFFRKYEDITIWDPKKYFCDEAYCYLMNDRKLLYRDRVHLTLFGSEYFAEKLKIH